MNYIVVFIVYCYYFHKNVTRDEQRFYDYELRWTFRSRVKKYDRIYYEITVQQVLKEVVKNVMALRALIKHLTNHL